tara:strand:+ start:148 stop:759 length:612 start_codon:yes stop_codon:yes gene_type:complete
MKRLPAYPFYVCNKIKIFNKVFFLSSMFFFYVLLFNPANAETYKLQCLYEKGKKTIIIDEESGTIKNIPALYGPSWNYRKRTEYAYVYEVAMLNAGMIYRFIIDLENLLEETIFLKVTKKNIEDIKMLKAKFDRGEISYDAIDQSKSKSFDQWFENPETTKNKVVKRRSKNIEGDYTEEYDMYENNSDLSYQFNMKKRCNFIN